MWFAISSTIRGTIQLENPTFWYPTLISEVGRDSYAKMDLEKMQRCHLAALP
jgi:hypothetical protein